MNLELGTGKHPKAGFLHHDRIKHAPYIDVAHDLNVLPWPFEDARFEKVIALDVMEHLRLDIDVWLDECWRILRDGGALVLRLPAWDNDMSYRDPTHRRVFHPETFHYWDPDHLLHRDFGAIYFAESAKWWRVEHVERTPEHDLAYLLRKRGNHAVSTDKP